MQKAADMSDELTKSELIEQAEQLGISLSARAIKDDYIVAIEAYSRGYTHGCEKSYVRGYEDAREHAVDRTWEPTDWPEAEQKLGRTWARLRYPALYDVYMREQREKRKHHRKKLV